MHMFEVIEKFCNCKQDCDLLEKLESAKINDIQQCITCERMNEDESNL